MNNRHHWRFNVAQKLQEPATTASLAFIRETVNQWPGVTEKPCYGTPGFYVNKKIFSRLREDGETLVIQNFDRDKWIDNDPTTFFITDHYLNSDYMLVDLKAVAPNVLAGLLLTAWRNRAPKKLLDAFDGIGY